MIQRSQAIVAIAVAAAFTLLIAVGWTSLGLQHTAQDMAMAEAHAYQRRARHIEPTDAGLAALVEANAHEGLQWIGLGSPRGEFTVTSGPTPDFEGQRGPVRRLKDGHMVVFGPVNPELARAMVERGLEPEALAVAFVPRRAHALARRARISFGIAGLVGLLLVGAAVWFARVDAQQTLAERGLEDTRRLAKMGEMTAVLAHEIKNPLASLKGHAQLLEELLEGKPEEERAQRVVSEAIRIQNIVQSLLEFARREQIQIAETEIGPLLESVTEVIAGPIDVVCPPLSWAVDPSLLRRAVTNLVGNARQASDEVIDLHAETSDHWLVITVRDRGAGIDGQSIEELCEPFHTTRTRGTGLGLAIASRIAHAHAGRLDAADHPDGGAVFTLTLPGER
ncbi:MAG: hypothetical protein KC912_15835 [Proteobacteria bacterium]|nr:hypothetical protein [Pseudomonadota bacterium]